MLKVILYILIILFFPIFILEIAAAYLSMYGVIIAAALCISGLVKFASKISANKDLCRKMGICGITIFLIVSILGISNAFTVIAKLLNFMYTPLSTFAIFLSPCLLLLYRQNRDNGKWEGLSLSLSIVGAIASFASNYFSRLNELRGNWILFLFTFLVTALPIAGILVLVVRKSKDSRTKLANEVTIDISKAENQSIIIIVVGAVIRILLSAISQHILIRINGLRYIPLIIIATGLVLLLFNKSFVSEKE